VHDAVIPGCRNFGFNYALCMYCAGCQGELGQLRDPETGPGVFTCHAMHRHLPGHLDYP
jgi:hypothetical protein